jgi:hypothetical protein
MGIGIITMVPKLFTMVPQEQIHLKKKNVSTPTLPRCFLNRPYTVSADRDNLLAEENLCSEYEELQVTVDELVDAYLNTLDTTKACGPDGISARLLKECSFQIAPSLCELFNYSLRIGRLPSEWKAVDITTTHKKESREHAENYRPIPLLPVIAKLLERCVGRRLYEHMISAISPLQHGFVRNRSCITQLLRVLHSIGQNLDQNIQTDIL